MQPSVTVIITAKDAAGTVGKSVASALQQGIAAEVVVVDDGSTDRTADVAHACNDGTGRLNVIRLEKNYGPSYGRNVAIKASKAPYFCILDADDFLGPDRLQKMFTQGGTDWDALADDIIFCREMEVDTAFDRLFNNNFSLPAYLDLPMFVRGNLPKLNRYRRELGFIKPVIKRAAVERIDLRYDERLRLGEDMIYYTKILLSGGQFRLINACGYYSVQHHQSLSAQHRTKDIAALYVALLEAHDSCSAGRALSPCVQSTRKNLALREALDRKRDRGWIGFMTELRKRPDCVPHILKTIARDKLGVKSLARFTVPE